MNPLDTLEKAFVVKEVYLVKADKDDAMPRHIVILRLKNYSNKLSVFNDLLALARRDGFSALPQDVRIQKYNTSSYANTHGIEFDHLGELPTGARDKYQPVQNTAHIK